MSTITEYDEAKRNEAKTSGGPLPRMAGPGLPLPGENTTVLCWVRAGKLMMAGADRQAVAASPAALLRAWTGTSAPDATSAAPTPRLVVADRKALRIVLRTVAKGGKAASVCEQEMQYNSRLAASHRLVVLTDALTNKFWLPAGLDATDINVWREAFRLTGGVQELGTLLSLASDTAIPADSWGKTVLGRAHSSLRAWCNSGSWGASSRTTGAAINAYQAADRIGEAWTIIEHFDPLLRYRFLHDGTVVRFTPSALEAGTAAITGEATQPFRLREGKVSVLVDSPDSMESVAYARMLSASFDNGSDTLIARLVPFRKPGESKGTGTQAFERVDGARVAKEELLLTAEPFLMGPRKKSKSLPTGSRWTRTEARSSIGNRDVPLDVLIAGGVEDD